MKMIAANISANDTLYWKVSSNFSDHSLVRVENLSLFESNLPYKNKNDSENIIHNNCLSLGNDG